MEKMSAMSCADSQSTVGTDLTASECFISTNETSKLTSSSFWAAVKSPSDLASVATPNCRICLQSRAEVNGCLCRFLRTVACGSKPNALFQLECSCRVGSMGHMCFSCLQTFETRQGRLCDLCRRPLFPDAGPDLLLALLHGSRYLALASLLSMLLLALSGCLRPELIRSMSGAQSLLPVACIGLLALSAALFALFARQFRAGVCPPCRRYRTTDDQDGEVGDVEAQRGGRT